MSSTLAGVALQQVIRSSMVKEARLLSGLHGQHSVSSSKVHLPPTECPQAASGVSQCGVMTTGKKIER